MVLAAFGATNVLFDRVYDPLIMLQNFIEKFLFVKFPVNFDESTSLVLKYARFHFPMIVSLLEVGVETSFLLMSRMSL